MRGWERDGGVVHNRERVLLPVWEQQDGRRRVPRQVLLHGRDGRQVVVQLPERELLPGRLRVVERRGVCRRVQV